MSRRVRRFLAVVILMLGVVLMFEEAAVGRPTKPPVGKRGIDVVQVDGYLDPPNVSLVLDSIKRANKERATLLVFQLDSAGALETDGLEMVRAIVKSRVPVGVWIGPSGADAKGVAALLVEAASFSGISPGSNIGPASPLQLDDSSRKSKIVVPSAFVNRSLSANEAVRAKVVGDVAPVLGDFIVSLDGKSFADVHGATRTLDTAKVVGKGRNRRLQPNQEVRFARLDLQNQLLHTLDRPSVAYGLFLVGLSLIVFEFFTAAIGLAGAVGALCLIGACLGFSHLPVQWWAAGLLMLAVFGFAIDVQAGGLGAWTIIGTVALVAGSLTLYGGSARLDPPWWVLVLVCLGTILFFLGAMTAVTRSRFSTPTVGREGMIGELGTAEADVRPDGVVRVRNALWKARTNRATPIGAGEAIRVVSVEGLWLEVEPEAGGARDYRERRH